MKKSTKKTGIVNQKLMSQLSSESMISLAIKVFSTIVLMILHVCLTRTMGVNGYGIYAFAMAIVGFFMIFSELGFRSAATRYVAKFAAEHEWKKLAGILRTSTRLVWMAGLVFGGVLMLAVKVLGNRLESDLSLTLYLGALMLPVLTVTSVISGSILGFERVRLSQLPENIIQPCLLGMTVLAISALSTARISAPVVMIATLAVSLLGLLCATKFLKELIPAKSRNRRPEPESMRWLRLSMPFLFISAMHIILTRIDIIMLGFFRGTAESGIYSVASRVSSISVFFLVAFGVAISPLLSRLHAEGRLEDLKRVLRKITRLNFAFAMPCVLLLFLASNQILGLFGPEFKDGSLALVVLVCGYLPRFVIGPAGLVTTMTGHEKATSVSFAITAMVNIVLNICLIPALGMNGAAISTAFSLGMREIALAYFNWRRLGLGIVQIL